MKEWEEIRARSASPDGKLCCADCYYSFIALGFACSKHATPEERATLDKRMLEVSLSDHPFFKFIKKDER